MRLRGISTCTTPILTTCRWVRSVAVEPGNEWFATGSADRTIKIWDLASGQLKLTLTGHIEQVPMSPWSCYVFHNMHMDAVELVWSAVEFSRFNCGWGHSQSTLHAHYTAALQQWNTIFVSCNGLNVCLAFHKHVHMCILTQEFAASCACKFLNLNINIICKRRDKSFSRVPRDVMLKEAQTNCSSAVQYTSLKASVTIRIDIYRSDK